MSDTGELPAQGETPAAAVDTPTAALPAADAQAETGAVSSAPGADASADADPVAEPPVDPRIAYRGRLQAINGRAMTAKRRLMLDELAECVADLAALMAEMLG